MNFLATPIKMTKSQEQNNEQGAGKGIKEYIIFSIYMEFCISKLNNRLFRELNMAKLKKARKRKIQDNFFF